MELKSNNFSSLKYHDIFDYKLTKEELIKWRYKNIKETTSGIKNRSRLQREKYSKNKLKIAKNASFILSKIPTIKLIALTGALAMNNADKNSDIDLMIITKERTLWTTRIISYLILSIYGFRIRKPRDKKQKDKLCLNMWLDENDLIWKKEERNIYSAHELAQIYPLVNKNKTYEKLLNQNSWILNYWPNAVKIGSLQFVKGSENSNAPFFLLEKIAFCLQRQYMKNKITREVITPSRAIFHPNDWGKIVLSKLQHVPRNHKASVPQNYFNLSR